MPHIRFQRRSLALAAGSLLLAAQVSACGFSNATDEIYQSSEGVDYRKGPLDVLSAVVVSAQEGSGTFIATFSNNEEDTDTVVQAIAGGTDDAALQISGFTPIEVPARAFVNLADDPSIAVKGEFSAGQYVDVKITFDNTDAIDMSIPVVADEYQYDGLDVSGGSVVGPTANESPSEPTASESAH